MNTFEVAVRVFAALVADPHQQDPAWFLDRDAMKGQSNEALIDFYGRYLAA